MSKMGLRDRSLCNIKREVSEHDKETSLLSVYIGDMSLCSVEREMSLCSVEGHVSLP